MMINCMALNGIDALWERLGEELPIGKKAKNGLSGKEAVLLGLASLKSKWYATFGFHVFFFAISNPALVYSYWTNWIISQLHLNLSPLYSLSPKPPLIFASLESQIPTR